MCDDKLVDVRRCVPSPFGDLAESRFRSVAFASGCGGANERRIAGSWGSNGLAGFASIVYKQDASSANGTNTAFSTKAKLRQ